MKKNKRLTPGITIIAILLVIMMLMNALLSNFGDTLVSYMGGGSTVSSSDGSVITEKEGLAEGYFRLAAIFDKRSNVLIFAKL